MEIHYKHMQNQNFIDGRSSLRENSKAINYFSNKEHLLQLNEIQKKRFEQNQKRYKYRMQQQQNLREKEKKELKE